jgi:hypothetical protein
MGRQLMGRLRELDQYGMTGCSGSHKCIFSILVEYIYYISTIYVYIYIWLVVTGPWNHGLL